MEGKKKLFWGIIFIQSNFWRLSDEKLRNKFSIFRSYQFFALLKCQNGVVFFSNVSLLDFLSMEKWNMFSRGNGLIRHSLNGSCDCWRIDTFVFDKSFNIYNKINGVFLKDTIVVRYYWWNPLKYVESYVKT